MGHDAGGEAAVDETDVADADRTDVGRVLATESGDFGSLLGHFYRGEMERTTAWRQRFDETTKWAVTIIAAVLAYGFSSSGTHTVLLAGIVVTTSFLAIESRRYQTYDIWRSRVRLLQENFFANALDPREGIEHDAWRKQLSDDLRRPAIKTPYVEAFDRRLGRVYLPLLVLLLFAWIFRITVFETEATWLQTAAIGGLPGWVTVGLVGLFYVGLVGIAVWPRERYAMRERAESDYGEWRDSEPK